MYGIQDYLKTVFSKEYFQKVVAALLFKALCYILH